MKPWLPYVIAGGVVAGEGGGLLASGLEFNMLANMVQGFSFMESSAGIYRMLVLPCLIIGIVSLPIGLILLGVGLSKKQKMKTTNLESNFR
jgi:hypothetical protein